MQDGFVYDANAFVYFLLGDIYDANTFMYLPFDNIYGGTALCVYLSALFMRCTFLFIFR